jgi:carbon monoxide dehydrogenase subunit G
VVFALHDGGGTIHTNAQITGTAASMGEGVVAGVLDALIADFSRKVGEI